MKKYFDKWKNKNLWNKISDIIFILFIIALLIPSSRLEIGSFVNRIKAKIIQPSVINNSSASVVTTSNYNWELTNIDGNIVNLEQFRGKVIFLNLWATWCPPCIGEMPSIQSLYDEFKDNNNVVFLLISNQNNNEVKEFIRKKEYTFPVYTTQYKPPEVFETSSIPTTFLISKNGKIRIKETGAANWNGDKMKKIINKLVK